MNDLVAHIIESILSDENTEKIEEKEEYIVAEETMGVRHAINTFNCVFNDKKKNVEEQSLNEASSQKKNNQYKLRCDGYFPK